MTIDYSDINSLLGKSFLCPDCGREHTVPTRVIESGSGLTERLPELMAEAIKGRRVLLLCDDITHQIAGKRLGELLGDAGWQVRQVILEPQGSERVHADEQYFPAIRAGAKDCDLVLTVGSGGITDMGKFVADEQGLPCVSFPTAPSMNAYTSSVSALMIKGVKTTLNVRPPLAVFVDTAILMNAPLDLVQAGFADYTAKSYADTDWHIASVLSGEYYCPLPAEMSSAAEKKFTSQGAAVKARDEQAIGYLIDGLMRGGISMVLAGSSSPASGGEHMISHYLDMESHLLGREPYSYHGIQVGIGVTISAGIYERLRNMTGQEIGECLARRQAIDYAARSREYFPRSFDIVWNDFKKKIPLLERLGELLPNKWKYISEEILPRLASADTVRQHLRAAGCPDKFSDIGVDEELARRAVSGGRFIRGRLTVLDIADELGVLGEIIEEL